MLIPHMVFAQATGSYAGPSKAGVKSFIDPFFDLLTDIVFGIAVAADYLLHTPALATVLSASVATFVAVRAIQSNRATVRLRETYSSISSKNWDKDVIEARKAYRPIRENVANDAQLVRRYADQLKESDIANYALVNGRNLQALIPLKSENFKESEEYKEHERISSALLTILNDYEYMALGIRLNIIDEDFAFKGLRGGLLHDWKALSPLANAIREKRTNSLLFIEFEGLASAWAGNKSYKSGKKMKPTEKRVHFN